MPKIFFLCTVWLLIGFTIQENVKKSRIILNKEFWEEKMGIYNKPNQTNSELI